MRRLFTNLALLAAGVIAALVPLRPYMDFQVLFHADLGLRLGIPLYDQPGQVAMIARFAGVPPEQVYVLPFPYPPWYALSTIWLAWLQVNLAARVWLWLNLLMLVASVVAMTRGQSPLRRWLLLLGAIFWLPAMGSLLVGQYVFPVLLGAALMALGLRREQPIVVAGAAALMTFKPHLGLASIALVLTMLLLRRDRFARQATLAISAAGAVLLGLGFLASPRWPLDYAGSLMDFQGVHGVAECTQCVSIPVLLARLFGGGPSGAVWVMLILAIGVCAWIARHWKSVAASPQGLVSVGALTTLLVSPYLLNYDFVLLLVPLIMLASEQLLPGEWIALGTAYALPAASLALWGSNGNPSLIASTCIVLLLALRALKAGASRLSGPALDG